MESFERLELSFLSLPQNKISTSIIAPDGTRIVQSSFEGFDCPTEWVTTLKAMAAAAKNAHFADGPASSSPSSPTSNRSHNAFHSRRSSVHQSGKRRWAPTTPRSRKISDGLQPTWSCQQDIFSSSSSFPGNLDEAVTSLLPLGPGSPSSVNASSISSAALVVDAGRQLPMDVISQATCAPIAQSPVSSNIAGDPGVNLSLNQGAPTVPSPCSTIRRTQKLGALLEAIKDGGIPDKIELNDTVRRLHQNSSAMPQSATSMEQFGHILGRLGNISSAVGIIYSLLSWEVFRWEEERLVKDEGRALLAAAKQVRYRILSKCSPLTL